jgi:hypothetical protein
MPYLEVRIDPNRAQISRTSDLDAERKKCNTSGFPYLKVPPPKKMKKEKARKKKKSAKQKKREKK